MKCLDELSFLRSAFSIIVFLAGTGLVPPALANNDNDKKDSDEASAMADNN